MTERRGAGAMESGIERLTLSQIRYLTELSQLGTKKGAVKIIADRCNVTHPTVSRFFRDCREKGYLTKEYRLTESGTQVLEWNRHLARCVDNFLTDCAVHEEKEQFLKALIEHVDYDALQKNIPALVNLAQDSAEAGRQAGAGEEGKPVTVSVFRSGRSKKVKKSMADRGFQRIGYVVEDESDYYLELFTKEMHAVSVNNGTYMSGHLSSLKYHDQGRVVEAKIEKGRLRIPMSAFQFRKFSDGITWGSILITVKSSVGIVNMPESTARLMIMM